MSVPWLNHLVEPGWKITNRSPITWLFFMIRSNRLSNNHRPKVRTVHPKKSHIHYLLFFKVIVYSSVMSNIIEFITLHVYFKGT